MGLTLPISWAGCGRIKQGCLQSLPTTFWDLHRLGLQFFRLLVLIRLRGCWGSGLSVLLWSEGRHVAAHPLLASPPTGPVTSCFKASKLLSPFSNLCRRPRTSRRLSFSVRSPRAKRPCRSANSRLSLPLSLSSVFICEPEQAGRPAGPLRFCPVPAQEALGMDSLGCRHHLTCPSMGGGGRGNSSEEVELTSN